MQHKIKSKEIKQKFTSNNYQEGEEEEEEE